MSKISKLAFSLHQRQEKSEEKGCGSKRLPRNQTATVLIASVTRRTHLVASVFGQMRWDGIEVV